MAGHSRDLVLERPNVIQVLPALFQQEPEIARLPSLGSSPAPQSSQLGLHGLEPFLWEGSGG